MSNLPITTETLDKIPEDARKFYAAGEDGKYNLDPAGLYEALNAKNKALDSERKIRTDFETKYQSTLKEYEGVDKNEYQKLRDRQKDWDIEKEAKERETLEAKGKYEEALERTKNTHTKEVDSLKGNYQKKIDELDQLVKRADNDKRDYILGDKVRRAITKAGVFAEDIDDVLALTKHRFNLDDQLNVTVKDENGNTISDSLDVFFGETFKKAKPKFYQGGTSSGSGASGGGKSTKLNTNELSSIDKISQGLANRKR